MTEEKERIKAMVEAEVKAKAIAVTKENEERAELIRLQKKYGEINK